MLPPQRLTREQPDRKPSGQGALCASLTQCLALPTEVSARAYPSLEGMAVGHPEAEAAVKHLLFHISVGQETDQESGI